MCIRDSRKILWKSVCKDGGTTPEGVREKRGELLQQSTGRQNLQNSFRSWMRSNAPDPKLYDKLDHIYTCSMIPNAVSYTHLKLPHAKCFYKLYHNKHYFSTKKEQASWLALYL